jgi:hypothetical protein
MAPTRCNCLTSHPSLEVPMCNTGVMKTLIKFIKTELNSNTITNLNAKVQRFSSNSKYDKTIKIRAPKETFKKL